MSSSALNSGAGSTRVGPNGIVDHHAEFELLDHPPVLPPDHHPELEDHPLDHPVLPHVLPPVVHHVGPCIVTAKSMIAISLSSSSSVPSPSS